MNNVNDIRILLVDDEEKFLQAVAERLILKGFRVTSATNGEAALKAATKDRFDVAVVDLQMPGIDGTQLLKTLKGNHQFLEIIMLTGHATVDSAVECTKLGAYKYLEKPYSYENLVEVLKEAYQHRMQKKFESNQNKIQEMQKLSLRHSPLGLLKALSHLDDSRK